MPWKNICEHGIAVEVIELLLSKLNEICIENVPKKNKEGKKKGIPKEIKKLMNRIKMLKREKHEAYIVSRGNSRQLRSFS